MNRILDSVATSTAKSLAASDVCVRAAYIAHQRARDAHIASRLAMESAATAEIVARAAYEAATWIHSMLVDANQLAQAGKLRPTTEN